MRRICLISATLKVGLGTADANIRLAEEFERQGYRVALCGLHDPFCSEPQEGKGYAGRIEGPFLRLPKLMSWALKMCALERFLTESESDRLIFRYIPYNFDDKGIAYQAAWRLPPVLIGRRTIFLVDEIWLGSVGGGLKWKLTGFLQRPWVLRLLRKSRPIKVYTNTLSFSHVLARHGISSGKLALFGNIPPAQSDGGAWLIGELAKRDARISVQTRDDWLLLGNFGVFYSGWSPAPFFGALSDCAQKLGRKIGIVGIGELGATRPFWEQLVQSHSERLSFWHLGRQAAGDVSRFLQSVDFGVTSNAYNVMGKSGTCMAMFDHGLPVIVPRVQSDDDISEFEHYPVVRFDASTLEGALRATKRRVPDPQLPRTVAALLADLDVQASEQGRPQPA